MTRPEAQITSMGSAALQIRVDYEQAIFGKAVHADVISAGGHPWRIECYPRGILEGNEYLAIHIRYMDKTRNVRALFEAFLLDRRGQPCRKAQETTRISEIRTIKDCEDAEILGWDDFISRTRLERDYVFNGHFTFVCSIVVIHDSPIGPVPPSDIGSDLGRLLDQEDGTDVSFIIDGEVFRVHRALLAARSPVFKAELFGSMAEATMPAITLHDITPATFRVMLRFIYTDEFPGEDELVDSSVEMFQDLLAAADRYGIM